MGRKTSVIICNKDYILCIHSLERSKKNGHSYHQEKPEIPEDWKNYIYKIYIIAKMSSLNNNKKLNK